MDIYRRSKPQYNIIFLYFHTTSRTDCFNDFTVPRTCQQCRARPSCCTNTTLWQNPKPCRPVCRHKIRHAVLGQITNTKRISNACIGLSAQQIRKFFIRKLRNKFLQRNTSFCDIYQHFRLYFRFFPQMIWFLTAHFRRKPLHFLHCQGL